MTTDTRQFETTGSGKGRPVRLLLVEDNPADVRFMREMLRESKVSNELLVAHTAEEAEEFLGLGEIFRVVDAIDEFWFQVVRLPDQ